METKYITPDSLISYYDYFTECNPDIDIFGDFFYIATDLIDLDENVSFHEHIGNIIEETDFESEEEIKVFGDKYIEFFDSVIDFFEMLEKIDSDEEINELTTELYYAFQEIYNDDFETLTKRIKEVTIETINVITNKYDVKFNEVVSNEKFESELNSKIGPQYGTLIIIMLTMAAKIDNEPESIDELSIKTLFTVLIIFIFNMNMKRNNEEVQNNNLKEQYKNVGRNDPCPCQSGKKYKKCCLKLLK